MQLWFDGLTMRVHTKSSSGESRPGPCCLPSASKGGNRGDLLFWALLASGQITMRKVDGWRSLNERPSDQTIDLAA
jgi:hypothetical protein